MSQNKHGRKPLSVAAKRMNRPHKLESASLGYIKISNLMLRIGVTL